MALSTNHSTIAVGIAALAAYSNAKFHLAHDIQYFWQTKQGNRQLQSAVKQKRVSPWYLFEERAASLGDSKLCLWSRAGTLTWRQAYQDACKYAHFLQRFGVRRGHMVALFLTNSNEFILSYLAAWALGSATALVNYNLSGDALIHCLKLCGSKVVLVDSESVVRSRIEALRERIEGDLGMTIVVLDDARKSEILSLDPVRPDDNFRESVDPQDAGMIIFTSGTTGFPKAVPIHIGRHYPTMCMRCKQMGINEHDRFYDCMPLYHGTGGLLSTFCMTGGIGLAVGKRFSSSKFWNDVRDSGATAFVYVGETLRYLLANPPGPDDRRHQIRVIFGNGLRPDVWKAFRDRFGIDSINEFFNSTEGVLGMSVLARGDFLATAVGHHGLIRRLTNHNSLVPIALSPTSSKDFYRSSRPPHFATRVSYSKGGEILVRVRSSSPTDSGFQGYLDNPAATEERFARDVLEKGDVFYRSSDALRRDNDGRWYFLDRLGDTFRWKSENVSTAEVAVALGDFPGVLEANVYGVLVPKHDGRAGCAAVFLKDGPVKFDWRGLLAHLRERLPRYAVPVFLRVVPSMEPMMHNNKQNKTGLREEGIDLERIESGSGDRIFWSRPGGEGYVEFGRRDLESLEGGKSKL